MTFTIPDKYLTLTTANKIQHKCQNLLTIHIIHLIDYVIREYNYYDLTVPL